MQPADPAESSQLGGIPRATIHELRTPLTSIRGYAQLLQRGVRSPEQAQRAYDTIFREAERLGAMLDQLALVAEIRMQATAPEVVSFDLGEAVGRILEQARERWPDHTITCRAQPGVVASADPRRVAEIVQTLIGNAASYSAPGTRVTVRVGRTNGEASVVVADQGIGIPVDELETIFQCFKRGSNLAQAEPAPRGLGIGLFVARAIASTMGGQLWAESNGAQGSAFHLTIPLAR